MIAGTYLWLPQSETPSLILCHPLDPLIIASITLDFNPTSVCLFVKFSRMELLFFILPDAQTLLGSFFPHILLMLFKDLNHF